MKALILLIFLLASLRSAASAESAAIISGLDHLPQVTQEQAESLPAVTGEIDLSVSGHPLPHDADSNTYFISQSADTQLFDGSIILLHDLHKTTVEGSIRAMQEMIEGDYEFLTVTELLSRNGTPPKPSTDYQRG